MIPYLQNCPHQGEGWCLKCVGEMYHELQYLKWFRLNCDFGPAEGDVINDLNERYKSDTGNELPEGWGEE
jgi:hypothetical protein